MDDDKRDVLSLIDHLFLPPKLPQAAPGEERESRINTLMCQTILDSAESYMSSLSTEDQRQWFTVTNMLRQLLRTSQVPMSNATLQKDLSQMKENGADN